MKPIIRIFDNSQETARELASTFLTDLIACTRKQGFFNVALSGGSTPKLLFSALVNKSKKRKINWENVHLFWVDERCVPPEHDESNYGMTAQHLIKEIDIPVNNIHRIIGEANPGSEATRYSHEIMKHARMNDRNLPIFDWILLGLGRDGHTASIFTDMQESSAIERVCIVTVHPDTGQKRISITIPVINQADKVFFFVTGSGKREIVRRIFERELNENKALPALLICPDSGRLEWYLDSEASSALSDDSDKFIRK